MKKVQVGPLTLVYPMPAFLIGAVVDDKPNFLVAAWSGIACSEPPMISVSIRPNRYTGKGIKQNSTFSVNIPSVDLARETDYCGMVTGAKEDKVKTCGFTVFYGSLKTAPMIEQCPVNLECKVVHVLNLGSHDMFVGKIEQTYVTEDCLTDGKADVAKIKPFVFVTGQSQSYYALGESIGQAFSIGSKLKK